MSKHRHDEHDERHDLEKIFHELREIRKELHQLLFPPATSLDLSQQIGGNNMGVITGIKAGATETFDLSPLPVGSSLQTGAVPSYTSDNSTDVSALVPSADGLSFSVTGNASFAAASFNVTASAVSSNGSPLSKVFNIPLLGGTGGTPATDLDLNQRVGASASFRR